MTTPEDLQARAGEAAALMKAMSNPHRLLILCMLCGTPGTSAGDLARATGIRPTTISDYYNEIAERMNLNHLDLICEALDCEPDEILVRVPNPEPRVRNRTGFEKPATESKVGI